jgi:SAM-dependent methyltransferase
MDMYKLPLYYEVAFSFFDVKKQVDTFEEVIKKFSKIRVKRFLDVACGPSPQLRELARRGYGAVGLDVAPEMLEHLSKRAEEEGRKIETVQADMCNFRLEKKVDFAFIMMGSLVVESNERFLSHLDSVASSLRKGGLYFIQNVCVNWASSLGQSWDIERDGIKVKTVYNMRWKDMLNQIFTEDISLEVNDHGRELKLKGSEDLKFIFPQEFKVLVELSGRFEFLGWWEGNESTWYLDKPLEKAESPSNLNMVLLRRK